MPASPLHIVLHQPEIPQNTGNIGRTCVAVGASLWLVQPLGFRLDEKRLQRAGLDYWQHLDVQIVPDWNSLLERLPTRRLWLFTRKATRPHWQVSYQCGDALVFGSETQGLPDSILQQHTDELVQIPMTGPVRSLNLSNAAAIGTYEAIRQFS